MVLFGYRMVRSQLDRVMDYPAVFLLMAKLVHMCLCHLSRILLAPKKLSMLWAILFAYITKRCTPFFDVSHDNIADN